MTWALAMHINTYTISSKYICYLVKKKRYKRRESSKIFIIPLMNNRSLSTRVFSNFSESLNPKIESLNPKIEWLNPRLNHWILRLNHWILDWILRLLNHWILRLNHWIFPRMNFFVLFLCFLLFYFINLISQQHNLNHLSSVSK
jgi:hypothetical protein